MSSMPMHDPLSVQATSLAGDVIWRAVWVRGQQTCTTSELRPAEVRLDSRTRTVDVGITAFGCLRGGKLPPSLSVPSRSRSSFSWLCCSSTLLSFSICAATASVMAVISADSPSLSRSLGRWLEPLAAEHTGTAPGDSGISATAFGGWHAQCLGP